MKPLEAPLAAVAEPLAAPASPMLFLTIPAILLTSSLTVPRGWLAKFGYMAVPQGEIESSEGLYLSRASASRDCRNRSNHFNKKAC